MADVEKDSVFPFKDLLMQVFGVDYRTAVTRLPTGACLPEALGSPHQESMPLFCAMKITKRYCWVCNRHTENIQRTWRHKEEFINEEQTMSLIHKGIFNFRKAAEYSIKEHKLSITSPGLGVLRHYSLCDYRCLLP